MGSTTPEMLEKAVLYIGEAMEELGMKVDKRNAVDTFRKTYKA